MIKVIDSHAHISSPSFEADREDVVGRAKTLGVSFFEIGTDFESSEKVLDVASKYSAPCALGIHPHEAGKSDAFLESWRIIAALIEKNRETVLAVGEIGLDYYRNLSPKDVQIACFEAGLNLAKEKGLPVVIHQRDAFPDVISILKGQDFSLPVIFHCFQGDQKAIKECLFFDAYFGLGGTVTYPKNKGVRDALRYIPQDKILLETDCPYLPPQSKRGKRNEPSYVLETLSILASEIGLDAKALAPKIRRNTKKALGVGDSPRFVGWE